MFAQWKNGMSDCKFIKIDWERVGEDEYDLWIIDQSHRGKEFGQYNNNKFETEIPRVRLSSLRAPEIIYKRNRKKWGRGVRKLNAILVFHVRGFAHEEDNNVLRVTEKQLIHIIFAVNVYNKETSPIIWYDFIPNFEKIVYVSKRDMFL